MLNIKVNKRKNVILVEVMLVLQGPLKEIPFPTVFDCSQLAFPRDT